MRRPPPHQRVDAEPTPSSSPLQPELASGKLLPFSRAPRRRGKVTPTYGWSLFAAVLAFAIAALAYARWAQR